MDAQIIEFLDNHRIGCLTTLLGNGSPHSAAVHFANSEEPFAFYFSTEKTTKKVQGMISGKVVPASLVIGFSEEEWKTLQMNGNATIATGRDLAEAHKVYYTKYPSGEKHKDNPDTVFIKFTPNWYRFTDYKQKPPNIVTSED